MINCKVFGYFTNKQGYTICEPIYGQILLSNCTNFIIKNQIIMRTGIGILVKFSKNIVIVSNNCSNNKEQGILLSQTDNSIIKNNSIYSNQVGIKLEKSAKNEITYNKLSNNTLWGVFLDEDSNKNAVHHNTFLNNNQYYENSQAYDDGEGNIWYDENTKEGNYWNNYQRNGNYSIDGSAKAYDLYPLAEPPVYIPPNYYGYFAFLSLVIVIPAIILGLKRYRKRKEVYGY